MDPDRRLERLLRGDASALDELYLEHGGVVFRVARRMLGQVADAEDATQEVFLKLFQRAGQFQGRARFTTWLTRMTIHHCLHRIERERLRAVESMPAEDTLPASNGHTPLRAAEASEARERLDALLQELSLEHRVVLHLREVEGFSYDEIASATGVPVGTVMSRLSRARARLVERAERAGRVSRLAEADVLARTNPRTYPGT